MKAKLSLVIMPQFWFRLLFEPSCSWPAATLGLAALLDYGIGDPWNWLHPVQVMGYYIQR